MNQQNLIKLAVEEVGGLTALANALGVRPPTVHQWLTVARPIPLRFCFPIEVATNGKVKRQDLRPNDAHLIWPDLREIIHA